MTLRRKILIIISAICLIFSIACWIELLFDYHYDNDVQYMFLVTSPCLIIFSLIFFLKQVFKSDLRLILVIMIGMFVFMITANSTSKHDDLLKSASDYYLEAAIVYDIETHLHGRDNLRFKSLFSNATGTADYYYFSNCKIGDTIIIKRSYKPKNNIINRIIVNSHPSHEDVRKYMEPVLYISGVESPIDKNKDEYYVYSKVKNEEKEKNNKQKELIRKAESKRRYKQLGYIFKKDSQGITKQSNETVYVGIKDDRLWKHEASTFENINIGDTILMELSADDPDFNDVVSWHPTPEEIGKYRTPVRAEEPLNKSIIADMATIKSKHTSQYNWPKYFVKLKYNNTVSDYIGIDDIYKKQIYESISAGDTVIVQKPKNNSEKIQVLSWRPTPEEIEKYRTQVRGTEITDN